jgi:serine/threonine protein kinase
MRVLKQGAQLADRYTLVRQLGSGGMSETWLAQDRQTEKSVALKFLNSELADQAGYRKLLRKEWQLGSRLMHANIVRVFEYYDDEPYYSLQYLDGPDISVLTGEDIGLVLRPIGLIADALRYAHGKNIVHRDIKASNILLDNRGAPYLIDFGVAAAPDQPATGGSPIASSPQQLAAEPASPKDDIYALGVLIHELVSGYPPADCVAPLKAKNGDPVPSSIETLVADMLAVDPGMRPDAESVTARLREAGFDPGLVPGRFIGGAEELDVQAVEATIRPQEHRAQAHKHLTEKPEVQSGISPRVLGGALAAALVLFLVVVFVLPRLVGNRDDDAAGQSANKATVRSELPNGDPDVLFNENIDEFATREERLRLKYDTEQVLGELLSKLETLEARAVERWGGQIFADAQQLYADGDQEYLRQNYRVAREKYQEAVTLIDPLLEKVNQVFEEAMDSGRSALEAGDSVQALLH